MTVHQWNKNALDLWHILQRRGVSFERWCQDNGIQTMFDFLDKCEELYKAQEFFVSDEMSALGMALPMPEDLPGYVPPPPFPLYADDGKVTKMSDGSPVPEEWQGKTAEEVPPGSAPPPPLPVVPEEGTMVVDTKKKNPPSRKKTPKPVSE